MRGVAKVAGPGRSAGGQRRSWRRRGLRLWLVAAAVTLLASACRMDVNVAVDVTDDGSGAVRVGVGLDDAAMRRVPDLEDQLVLDDLVDAGWLVSGPAEESDGRTWIRATKPFANPDEAATAMREISGPDGPFRDFTIDRDRSFLKTRWHFTGDIDLSAGIDGFSDDALRERLDGTSFGIDTAELERHAGAALDRVFGFQVAVLLPGEVSSNAPVSVTGGAIWSPSLGEEARLRATGERWNIAVLTWTAVAALAAAGLVAVLLVRVRRWRRSRPEEPGHRTSDQADGMTR